MQIARVKTEPLFRCVAALALVVALASATFFVQATPARAEAVTYSNNTIVYKVGVLELDSTDIHDGLGPENPDPYVFYIADQRNDIKPAGWDLENPLAPASVTSTIQSRWAARDPNHPYVVGQKVTKDMAAYWEVPLSETSEADLEQYDLLFITNHRTTAFTPSDREKLRKIVDGGAVVWIEDCGGMQIGSGNTTNPHANGRFFLDQLQFHSGGTGTSATAGPQIDQPTHPILNTPYPLSYSEIANLGDKNYGGYYMYTENPAGNGEINAAPNPEVLTTVVGNIAQADVNTGLGLPYISAGIYGSGGVIATSGDSGCDINDYVGGFTGGSGGNSGAYCGTNLSAAHTEDLKFLYNLIAWGGANDAYRRNDRRTASSFAGVTAPLNLSFDFDDNVVPALNSLPTEHVDSETSPLISQGIIYVSGLDSDGNVTLRAYDSVPERDYDNDGNNDDGLPDLIFGLPFDEIWRWTGGKSPSKTTYPSSPVLATITNSQTGAAEDLILMTLPDGTVAAFEAKPNAAGHLLPAQDSGFPITNSPTATGQNYVAAQGTTTPGVVIAPAPVFFSNKIYAIEPNTSVVRCIYAGAVSASGGKNVFPTLWTSSTSTTQFVPTGTPTLGLNRLVVLNSHSGTNAAENTIAAYTNESSNDIMLYVPAYQLGTTGDTNVVMPFWLGARNEGTTSITSDGATSSVGFRPATTNADQYYVSPGGTGFITPSVTIYADVTTADGVLHTREENYAAGHPVYPILDSFFGTNSSANGAWTATWEASTLNSSFYNGRVDVTHEGVPLVVGKDRILAVADYDLVYVPTSGTPPTFLTTSGQTGSRNLIPLTVQNATGLDTVAFAPNDLLIYGVNQTGTNGGAGAVFGMQEREYTPGGSRLRWRYLLHNGGGTAGTINGTAVSDLPALRNRMAFGTTSLTPTGIPSAQLTNVSPYYEPLNNATIVGSPAVTNSGVTYVLARATSGLNGPVAVLMAFQTSPAITLNMGEPIAPNSIVTVSQIDPLSGNTLSISGSASDSTNVDVDFNTGKVTIEDFGAQSGGTSLFSASSSFVVAYTPAFSATTGDTAQSPTTQTIKVIPPFASLTPIASATNVDNVLTAAATPIGGFSPLMWYYILPGTPHSSPVRIGDVVYFTIDQNVVALDADPTANDPQVHVGSGEQVYNVVGSLDGTQPAVNHLRWVAALPGTTDYGAIAGGEGIIAVNAGNLTNGAAPGSGTGVVCFDEGVTLLADNTRVMEVDSNGSALWSTDTTINQATTGGAAPIYEGNGTVSTPATTRGRETLASQPLRAPQTVRRLSAADYLVADTGNNRVVRFDRGGVLHWTVQRLNDPYNVLSPGDPTTLNGPTDVLVRTLATYDNSNPPKPIGFETHYLIADSGNGRIVDVVDYYNTAGQLTLPAQLAHLNPSYAGPPSGIVVWSTKTNHGSQKLSFHNLQLIAGQDSSGNYGKPILVASVTNASVAASNNSDTVDSTGGSVVQLDYNPLNTAFTLVDGNGNFVTDKYYSGGAYGGTSTAAPATDGMVLLAINQLRFVTTTNGTPTYTTKKLNSPTYFEEFPLNLTGSVVNGSSVSEPVYLITDNDGAYACTKNVLTNGNTVFDVIWSFQQADYDSMNSARFQFGNYASAASLPATLAAQMPRYTAASMKRLGNGHYLLTNSADSACPFFESGRFYGEVFEVIPPAFSVDKTTGMVTNSVEGGSFANFSAPAVVKDGTLTKQQMGTDKNGATVTEQPRSADRL